MGIITVSIDDEVEEKLRKKIGDEKGELGESISKAVEKWIEENESDLALTRLKERMNRAQKMGKINYEDRSELYEARSNRD